MARIQKALRAKHVTKFEDVTREEWQEMLDEASVEHGPLPVSVVWRNPDAMEQEQGFAFKDPRKNLTMPKFLQNTGVYLSAESRDGHRYCPLYQQGCCDMDSDRWKRVRREGQSGQVQTGPAPLRSSLPLWQGMPWGTPRCFL